MTDEPVVVQDKLTVKLRRNSEMNAKVLGDRILNRTPRRDRDRIQTALEEHSLCDPIPLAPIT